MSIDWSILVPGLLIAVTTGIAVGGTIDLSRRVAERRARREAFAREAPAALAAAHDVLVAGIPKDPTSLVPAEGFTRALRDQVTRLAGGPRRATEALPAIEMVYEIGRALEDMAVRGRALDDHLEKVMGAAPQALELRLVLKLARQAIQKDARPAATIPAIDNPEAQASLRGDAGLVAAILGYRRAQARLHDAGDAFVDHWWTVRELHLATEARRADVRLRLAGLARSAAMRDIDREFRAAVAADFRRRWARIDHGATTVADVEEATVVEAPGPEPEPDPETEPETAPSAPPAPTAKPGRTTL